ncbi:MAG TPA: toll/interleukin-1 receptor domain-containing protein, partial [Caulobacterales bacterium]|nr:toll/interleukin-1 receptor domain-containing protein [Caulobacterales bacterium]
MTVFIAFAEADRPAADTLEAFLERRGHFVELDNGAAALRPVEPSDVVVLLNSKDFPFAPGRLRLEQRALDAWSEGRLVLVKLDGAFAPVGLRDLPFIDASFEPRREFVWGEVCAAIQERQNSPARRYAAAEASSTLRSREARDEFLDGTKTGSKPKSAGAWLHVLLAALLLPGALAIAATVAIWLANRIGPTPGTLSDLLRGIDALGARFGLPSGLMIWLFAAALLLFVGAFAALVMRLAKHAPAGKETAEAAPAAAAPKAPGEAVFVSYARANAPVVLPVIDAAKQSGRQFWLDQDGIQAGDGWAGEIVRAIRGAKGVIVMCSSAAFESDHVKREVYLADRYKKPLVPVF